MTAANKIDPADIDAIVATLTQIVVELNVGISADRIDATSSLEDDLGLDSVALIELIGAVEAAFDFEFIDSDLRTSTFANLRSLAHVVATRSQASASA